MSDAYCYPAQGMQPRQHPNGSPSYAPLVACPPPSRQRRSRTMFSDDDVRRLEDFFLHDAYPDIDARERLAADIAVPEARIQTWFQNKRSRTRRQMNNNHARTPAPAPAPPPAPAPAPAPLPAAPVPPPQAALVHGVFPLSPGLYAGTSQPTGPDHSHYGLVPNFNHENVQPAGLAASQLLPPGRFAVPPPPAATCTPRAHQPAFNFRLQPPAPEGAGSHRDASSPNGGCEWRQDTTPSPSISPPGDDAEDCGVLDLSLRSNESPKASPATGSPPTACPASSTLRSLQVSPASASPQQHPDTGRPFFTPWATSPTPAASTPPPARAISLPAQAQAATSGPQPRVPVRAQFSLPPQVPAHTPWLYGFAPSFNSKECIFYYQPLPTSPFAQPAADTVFPVSPGLSPLISGRGGNPWSLSPSLNFPSPLPPHHFVFPEVLPATQERQVPFARRQPKRCPSPPCTAEADVMASPKEPEVAELTPTGDNRVSSSCKADGVSVSPGSDTGSRSSGYISREDECTIDVCN